MNFDFVLIFWRNKKSEFALTFFIVEIIQL